MNQPSSVRVVTVVLNYKHVDDTIRCVRSLRTSDFLGQRILVVDNAPDGPSTEALREQLDPDITVIATGGNLGYAGGNNVGITLALQQRPDFVWLINPDAVVDQGTLSALVEAADAHPDAGVVGCRILHGGSNPPRIASNGGRVDASRWGATPLRDSGRFDSEVIETGVREVGFVSGACLLLRQELIRDIGMLPEEYFLYFEETEYCLRAQRAGWRTLINQCTRIWHFKRSSDVLPSAYYIYYMCRNRIHFGVRYFDATVDDIISDIAPFVEKWRRRVEQHAPESLNAYDDLVHKAFEDGRFQRFGRVAEVESISFKPRVVAAERLEREYDQSTRDIQRLLRRIQKDATELKQVKEVVEQERRRGSALEAKLTALRRSRTYRVGRAIGKLATPVTAVRSAVARVKRTSSSS